jgi:translocation protein SEC63
MYNISCVTILGPNEMPRLETVESCIKLSQMVIQALDAKGSPLQQLPHIRPDMLRHFVTKRVSLNSIALDVNFVLVVMLINN